MSKIKDKKKYVFIVLFICILFFVFYTRDSKMDNSSLTKKYLQHQKLNNTVDDKKTTLKARGNIQKNPKGNSQKSASIHLNEDEAMWSKKEMDYIKRARNMAKVDLADIYTALVAFHADFSRYSSDLSYMGFEPGNEVLNYVYGFSAAKPFSKLYDGENPNRFHSSYFVDNYEQTDRRYVYTREAGSLNLSEYFKFCKEGCRVEKDKFELLLIIPYLENKGVDVYLINDRKEIIHAYKDY